MDNHATKPLNARYTIIERASGPLISDSRCTVFDVMELQDAGESLYAISAILNLTPLQVEIALEYVATHRAVLEPQLAQILASRVEREQYYRDLADKIFLRIAQEPMTQSRADLLAIRERDSADYGS
jgi:uncharacterized protein (DUF433 family)